MMCSSSSWSWYTFPADGNVGQKTDNRPECWTINFNTWYDPLEVGRVLSQEEKSRAERFSAEALARCFSVAHWGLRMLLSRCSTCRRHPSHRCGVYRRARLLPGFSRNFPELWAVVFFSFLPPLLAFLFFRAASFPPRLQCIQCHGFR